MEHKPSPLRLVEKTPWERPEAYRPNLLEALNRNERRLREPTFLDDLREFCAEVAAAPAHHAGFAVLVIVSWSVLIVAPILIAEMF